MQIFSFREEVVTGRQHVPAAQDADDLYSREGFEQIQERTRQLKIFSR